MPANDSPDLVAILVDEQHHIVALDHAHDKIKYRCVVANQTGIVQRFAKELECKRCYFLDI